MVKNNIIRVSSWLTKIILVIVSFIYILFFFVVIHWHFDPEYYRCWYLNGYQAGISVNISQTRGGISMSEISSSMLYWMFIRMSIIIFLILLILRKSVTIMNSIENLRIFYDTNVRSFKVLALAGLVLTGIGFFNFMIVDNTTSFYFTIPFGPLLFSSACFVLAEVFKEGKKLMDDSNSIV